MIGAEAQISSPGESHESRRRTDGRVEVPRLLANRGLGAERRHSTRPVQAPPTNTLRLPSVAVGVDADHIVGQSEPSCVPRRREPFEAIVPAGVLLLASSAKRLEKPDQQKDDDDERQKAPTDVHAFLLVVCGDETTGGWNRLRVPLLRGCRPCRTAARGSLYRSPRLTSRAECEASRPCRREQAAPREPLRRNEPLRVSPSPAPPSGG